MSTKETIKSGIGQLIKGAAHIVSFRKKQEERAEKSDKLYQVSLLQSLTLGGYDGQISVKELVKHGDIGIGTFDAVNGEMIVLDGKVYQALGDGTVVEAAEEETVPFATVGFMKNDIAAYITASDTDVLKNQLNRIVREHGENQFYVIKIDCTCRKIVLRTEVKQLKPYRPLDEALKTDQREYHYENLKGTIVGLYCPGYMTGINMPGWHFHYLSEDKKKGGHMFSIEGVEGRLEMDEISEFEMCCPNTDFFNRQNLGQDQSDRICSVEQKAA